MNGMITVAKNSNNVDFIKYSYSVNLATSNGLWKNLNIVKSPLLYKNNYNIFYREYKNSISSHVMRKYRILLNIIR